MDREIAQEYVNYRIGKGWRLHEIAQEHKIPTEFWHVLQGFYGILYMEQYVVDHIARQHAQLNR